ncbi:MAG: carboxypeptidase regulatory-like domain-containing protein [Flavobacteriales bacterium]|nr:carboxypeptidase regulatory-like domain-containing protein [Flavobacteriales bacterium]
MMWLVLGDPFGLLAQTTSTLSGRVTDATTAAPLVGATIQLFLPIPGTIGSTTDATGAFRLTDVPTGSIACGPVLWAMQLRRSTKYGCGWARRRS